MKYILIVLSLSLIACKDATNVASWRFEAWSLSGVNNRGLAHFTEDDSLYFDWQGSRKSTSAKVDRERRSGHDRITLTSKDTTFGTIVLIETANKNKEIRWELGNHLYKNFYFKRD